MTQYKNLEEVVGILERRQPNWEEDYRFAWDINAALWRLYDPNNDLIYPTVYFWDKLLKKAIALDNYDFLTKEQVLSIVFGLHHRDRIIDGLWMDMIERGVTLKLLSRLMLVDDVTHK